MENTASDIKKKVGFWPKLQSASFLVVALMLSLGQWNDTKEALNSGYELFVAHWTNDIEYKRLSKLHVGQTYDYITSILGAPHASKKSKSDLYLTYYYYGDAKYQLMLAVKDQRLSGYGIIGLIPDFNVPIPFTDIKLAESSIASSYAVVDSYYSDSNNLEYYAESHELGKNVMFYNLLIGSVNYGAYTDRETEVVKALNTALDRGEEDVLALLTVSRTLSPNYFAISELEPGLMVSGLLTHFEHKTLLASK
ncbi:hypothetical protein EKG38_21685 [Shewanella canadensis]|uniref:Uncharacterized protein n=1 Tax=Shewanella canadensis TaxID=271096 RepID=A0A3S0IJX3_9GAMM|nr:ETEC_3214 domain-containing protein [Shewanella canadensis]RTR36914.1 hypothetical protein EKG38_21685 [Shewanella canadensis]